MLAQSRHQGANSPLYFFFLKSIERILEVIFSLVDEAGVSSLVEEGVSRTGRMIGITKSELVARKSHFAPSRFERVDVDGCD